MASIKETYSELALEFKKTKSGKTFSKLYRKMRPNLKRYIKKIVKDSEVTEDILSATFSKVYIRIEQYNPDWQITTWAYKIAYHECLSYIKHRNKKVSLSYYNEMGSEATEDGEGEHNISSNSTPIEPEYVSEIEQAEEEHIFKLKYEYTVQAIKTLKPLYKDILVDNLLNGLKYKEIAKKHKLPLQTIKNRIRRGKNLVADVVGDAFDEIDI